MIRRNLTPLILESLEDSPVVFLRGPRQSGKTTLVRSLLDGEYDARYLTFDDAGPLAAATADPDGFVDALPERVVLDEIQRAPGLFRALKRSVDRRRTPGRFLLTGSANALVLPRVSESLAGRMETLTLWPFSQGELEGVVEGFVDACFAKTFPAGRFPGSDWPSLVARIVQGGFPEAVRRAGAARRRAWFEGYVTTLLERDVRDLTQIHALRELPRLLRLVAARTSGLLNLADLARDAALPLTTLQRHWALLEAIFFVRTLPPWSGGHTARLVKAPKVLICDTGLLCALLDLDAPRLERDDLMAGAALESFVAVELIRQSAWSRTRPALLHYRTHKQHEVDFVLEDGAGRIVGIEVKKTASPGPHDLRGLRSLAEATGKKFVRGLLLHTGETVVGFGSNLYAVPVGALWSLGAAVP